MSFLDESYLESESYLGASAEHSNLQMPPPNNMMPAPNPETMVLAGNGGDLIRIPFTDILITKQTAIIAAAILAVGAWYFFVHKKN